MSVRSVIWPSIHTSIDRRRCACICIHGPIVHSASMGSIIAGAHLRLSRVGDMVAFPVVTRGGNEIDDEREDPEGEDKSHNPFKNGGGLGVMCEVAGDEGNGKDN